MNIKLLKGKAMIVALVILGSYVGLASAGVPLAFAANTVSFYSDPHSATITVASTVETYGWAGTFAPGDRVHVIANPPGGTAGRWEFAGWVVKGVSIDTTLSPNTYITIGQGEGSVTAYWQHTDPHQMMTPPPPPSDDNTPGIPT